MSGSSKQLGIPKPSVFVDVTTTVGRKECLVPVHRPCSSEIEISFFRLGNEAQDGLRQKRAHMVHEQNRIVPEREAQIQFVRYQMESEQRTTVRILESVSQDRDTVRHETQQIWEADQRSESAAQLLKAEVQNFDSSVK